MNILLNQLHWQVKGYWPYEPLFRRSMELGNELLGVTDWIDATVPGGVHFDLLKAGLIEDPYFENNSLKCEWVENRWWEYKTTFTINSELRCKKLDLVFNGVDYKAHFFLNGKKLGEHEGMFETIVFDVSDKVNYGVENELSIILENVPWEMSQIGHTSLSRTQKSRFNYKWDFSTRMVNIGIWDDVFIRVTGKITLNDTFISTEVANGTGIINISSFVSGVKEETFNIKVTIYYNGSNIYVDEEKITADENVFAYNKKCHIPDPELWYPNGIGKQPLYKVKIEIYQKDRLSDEYECFSGIRKLEYRQNENSPEDSLPYTFVINDIPVYIKGVNLVPFDHLYGNVTKDTYNKYIRLIKYANINMVRVWGGGIIEKEYFYHMCDLNGIMVWQEFIQSSSGIDNIPSTDPCFLRLLKATAVQAVKTKRNHVCHTVWSGGNELMDENKVPCTYQNPNIKMLRDIINLYDPGKLFLPTSASGPNEYLNIGQPGKNYDVHGSWKYEGIEKHYYIYNHSDSLFHSEFGVEGCSSVDSLGKFLGENNLKITNMKDNLVWRHHGEWWDTLLRDQGIFGNFTSLEQFVKASQFVQAEGLRYILEANRRRKYINSGSIVWQLNEPWPNISNTCIVDYYSFPKMAYYWLKKAYAPIHASLTYDKLVYSSSEEFKGNIFLHNSLDSQVFSVVWEILDVTGQVIQRGETNTHIKGNSSLKLKEIAVIIPLLQKEVFFIRLWVYDSSFKECCQNLYIFSQSEQRKLSALLELEEGKLQIVKTDIGYKVKNIGKEVCLFIHGNESTRKKNIFIEDNYTSLFPGEERLFPVCGINEEQEVIENCPDISWEYFSQRTEN